MAAAPPNPAPILQLATGYWGSQALLTANRLGLFAGLGAEGETAPQTAARIATAERPTRLLLNACVALGLLARAGDRYLLTPIAAAYLVPTSPAFLGDALRYSDDLYGPWGRLDEAVRHDRPTLPPADLLGGDSAQTRHFVRAMHQRALGIARGLVAVVDLTGRRQLLDVGGGPGTYAALLTGRFPGLSATVLDLGPVVAIASEIVADLGAAERVHFLPGDCHTTPWPAGNDCLLISGFLHRESEASCRALLARAHAALLPGGQLIVADVFTDAGGDGPPFACLFGLNMLLSAEGGGVHPAPAMAQWMVDAGFTAVATHPLPPPMPHTALVGVRG